MMVTAVTFPVEPVEKLPFETESAVHSEILRQLMELAKDHERRIRKLEMMGWIIAGCWLALDRLPDIVHVFTGTPLVK